MDNLANAGAFALALALNAAVGLAAADLAVRLYNKPRKA